MNPALLAAFGALFCGVTCLAAGEIVLELLRIPFSRAEQVVIGFVTGGAALSLLVFLLTAAHLAYTSVFVVVGLATIGAAWYRLVRTGSGAGIPVMAPVSRWWPSLAILLAAPFVVLYASHALGPEYSPDGTAYHLGLVARYLREHHFPVITTNFYASFPEGFEMLFLFAFSVGRHSAAAAVHLLFLFAGCGILVVWGLRFGRPYAGIGAAVLFFLAPVVGTDATTAYVDVGEAVVVLALFFVLQVWRQENGENDRLLVLAGILAGFAAAIKYPGFIAPLYPAAVVVYFRRRTPDRWLRGLALIAIPAVLLAAPWLIKNAIEVGNPVSPFANRLFPNPYVHVSFEETWRARLAHWEGVTWPEIPREVTIDGGRLQEIVGPVFLLAPVALLSLADPVGRQVLFALLFFLLPYPGNILTRFLIPALPFLALAICIPLARWKPLLGGVLVFHLMASLPWSMRQYAHAGVIDENWAETLRVIPEDQTLRAHVDGYEMARYIDANMPDSARIYQIGGFPLAYTKHPVEGYYEGALGERLYYVFFSGVAAFPQWAPTWRVTFHSEGIRTGRVRIERGGGAEPVWAVSEVHFFDRGRGISRSPDWKLSASHFSRDTSFAFDGNLATEWKTWEQPRPGMFIYADFGAPTEISDIEIDAPLEQRAVSLSIRTDVPASWSMQSGEVSLPPGYRAWIGKAFRDAGYTHLIMKKGIPGYDDLLKDSGEWGMRVVAERDGYLLCEITGIPR